MTQTCTKCSDGFYFDKQVNDCSPINCTKNLNCEKCYFNETAEMLLCETCISGYYKINNENISCHLDPIGYYLDDDNTYQKCDVSCLSCNNQASCTTCDKVNGYYPFEDDLGNCSQSIPIGYLFNNEKEIIQKCEYENGKCKKLSTSVNDAIDETMNNLNQNLDYYLTNVELIAGPTYNIQISSCDELNNNNMNENININMEECIEKVKEYYHVHPSSIYIIKADIEQSQASVNSVSYYLLLKNKTKVDMSICRNLKAELEFPINPEMTNLTFGKFMNDKGYDIFNPKDKLFSRCYSYVEGGKNVGIEYRRSTFFQNNTLCTDNCQYLGINYTTNTVKCECEVEQVFNTTKSLNKTTKIKFNYIDAFTTIHLIVCTPNLTDINSDNMAVYYSIFYYIFVVCFGCIFICKNLKDLHNQLKLDFLPQKLEKNSKNNEEMNQINNKVENVQPNDFEIKDKNKSSIEDITSLSFSNDSKNSNSVMRDPEKNEQEITKNEKENNKSRIIEKKEENVNDMKKDFENCSFEEAIKIDQRSCFKIYWDHLKKDLIVFRLLFPKKYEYRVVLLFKFYCLLYCDLCLNCIFTSDEKIQMEFEEKLKLITTFIISLISFTLSSLLQRMLMWVTKYKNEISQLYGTNKDLISDEIDEIINNIKKRIIIIIIILSLIFTVLSLYLILFCHVYQNTQRMLLWNLLKGLIISIVSNISLLFLSSLFRVLSLGYKSKCLFITSKVFIYINIL